MKPKPSRDDPFVKMWTQKLRKMPGLYTERPDGGIEIDVKAFLASLSARKPNKKIRSTEREKITEIWEECFRKSTALQRVQKVVQSIRSALALSMDGLVRMRLPMRVVSEAGEALNGMICQGEVDDVWFHEPLSKVGRKAQLIHLVVFPPNWRNPFSPRIVKHFSASDEQRARTAVLAAIEKGHYARVLRHPEWVQDALLYNPRQFLVRLDGDDRKRKPGFVVEVWKPANFLNYLSVAYSQAELLDAIQDSTNPDNVARLGQSRARQVGAAHNKARAKQTVAEQQKAFAKMREKYPTAKKAFLIRKISESHPRKIGWGIRTLKQHLIDLV